MLRIWRRGKCEGGRPLDGRAHLSHPGPCHPFSGVLLTNSFLDLTAFILKYNGYASREALDVRNQRFHLFDEQVALTVEDGYEAGRRTRGVCLTCLSFAVGISVRLLIVNEPETGPECAADPRALM